MPSRNHMVKVAHSLIGHGPMQAKYDRLCKATENFDMKDVLEAVNEAVECAEVAMENGDDFTFFDFVSRLVQELLNAFGFRPNGMKGGSLAAQYQGAYGTDPAMKMLQSFGQGGVKGRKAMHVLAVVVANLLYKTPALATLYAIDAEYDVD